MYCAQYIYIWVRHLRESVKSRSMHGFYANYAKKWPASAGGHAHKYHVVCRIEVLSALEFGVCFLVVGHCTLGRRCCFVDEAEW